MKCEAVVQCHVFSQQAINVINSIAGPVNDVFRKFGIVKSVALNECLITFAARAAGRTIQYKVEHTLGIKIIPTVCLYVEGAPIDICQSFRRASDIVDVHAPGVYSASFALLFFRRVLAALRARLSSLSCSFSAWAASSSALAVASSI